MADRVKDYVDRVGSVQERVRKLEIEPGPARHRRAAAVDALLRADRRNRPDRPDHDRLHIVRAQPCTEPRHPLACELAEALWDEGFPNKWYSQAFMNALAGMGAWAYPSNLQASCVQRHEGRATDTDGTDWRGYAHGRQVKWKFFNSSATPGEGESQEWRYFSGPGPFYRAHVIGGTAWIVNEGDAGYIVGETRYDCHHSQLTGPPTPWPMNTGNGVEAPVLASNEPACFSDPDDPEKPPNTGADTRSATGSSNQPSWTRSRGCTPKSRPPSTSAGPSACSPATPLAT